MADFVLGRLKFKWRGDWAVSTAYLIDDIVKYGANLWITTVHHTTTSDIMNEQCFELFVEGLQFEDLAQDIAKYYKKAEEAYIDSTSNQMTAQQARAIFRKDSGMQTFARRYGALKKDPTNNRCTKW